MSETVIQFKRDTASNWTTDNPTLAAGEFGLETDTNKIKFGDGSTAWNSLPYVGAGSSFKYGFYGLSSNQTSNFTDNNHVEFDTKISGSLNSPSTGTGQDNGKITLSSGKTYKISCCLRVNFSNNNGYIVYKAYDRTNSATIGKATFVYAATGTNEYGSQPVSLGFVTPTSDIDVEVRFSGDNLSSFDDGYCWLLIEEYGGY